jgi:AraC-like DNA-binding protein
VNVPEDARQLERPITAAGGRLPAFSERAVWQLVGKGWRHLHGSIRDVGVSFEWHDFEAKERFDWGKSFHPGSVEVCLNVAGEARVRMGRRESVFGALTAGFYRRGDKPLEAWRAANQRHQFLTVEMSFDFLRRQMAEVKESLHPMISEVVSDESEKSAVAPAVRLTSRLQQLLTSLREPPVLAIAQTMWYQAKALELASELFFVAPDGQELFCQRQQKVAAERVEKVVALLRAKLAEPPTLEEIGQVVGCSPFHLSRTFSAATGMTIPQYLRQLRLERAAELLRSGKANVTEAAMEVGYSSLSHSARRFTRRSVVVPACIRCEPSRKPTSSPIRANPRSPGGPEAPRLCNSAGVV